MIKIDFVNVFSFVEKVENEICFIWSKYLVSL